MDKVTCEGIFAEKLRTLFNESKKTQKDLISYIEERTGKAPTRQAVSMWLRGNSPDIKTVPIIADFFGVSVDYLITDTDVRTTDTNLKAVCNYTGLSESAVEVLHQIKTRGEQDEASKAQSLLIFEAISSLFSSEGSKEFIKNLTMYRNSDFINAKITIEQDPMKSSGKNIEFALPYESVNSIVLLQIQDFVKSLKNEKSDGGKHFLYYYFYGDDDFKEGS